MCVCMCLGSRERRPAGRRLSGKIEMASQIETTPERYEKISKWQEDEHASREQVIVWRDLEKYPKPAHVTSSA